jgi:uncharacterized membrane protein
VVGQLVVDALSQLGTGRRDWSFMMPRSDARPRYFDHFAQTLVTGVFAILPLALTLLVLAWVVGLLHDLVGPSSFCGSFLRSIGMTVTACEVTAYLFGAVGAVLMVYGLGSLIERKIGARWSSAMDGAIQQIPVVSTLYDASKNLTSVFDRRQDSLQGMSPVVCNFGSDGAVAIPALMPTPDVVRMGGQDYHIVVIPTAPVPFGGALVCVKAEWVKPAECSFDEMVGVYMSMGTSAPRCMGDVDSKS